ncbi:hypothetical protein AYK61_10480 [Rhodococcus sp. SBT000017]|nr:hypothetical protein AYK61_10480 [Rhodococcus sp. SBT000017]
MRSKKLEPTRRFGACAASLFFVMVVGPLAACGSQEAERPLELAERPMYFGGIGDIVVGMSEADLPQHGVRTSPIMSPSDDCSRYEESAYGRSVSVYVKDDVVIGIAGQFAIPDLSGGSTVNDIKSAFPDAVFDVTTNDTVSEVVVSEADSPTRYLAFTVRSDSGRIADSDEVSTIRSGGEEFAKRGTTACVEEDTSSTETSSEAPVANSVMSWDTITFGGIGEIVIGTGRAELDASGIPFGSALKNSDSCIMYPFSGARSGAIWLENEAVIGAVGSNSINGVRSGMTAAEVKGALAGYELVEITGLAAPLIARDPLKPEMYIGFLFENEVESLSDNSTVTSIRGGTQAFVSTFLGGCP